MTQLGTYDQAKNALTPILGDNKMTHLASALTAAVVYSYASLPLVSASCSSQRKALSFVNLYAINKWKYDELAVKPREQRVEKASPTYHTQR